MINTANRLVNSSYNAVKYYAGQAATGAKNTVINTKNFVAANQKLIVGIGALAAIAVASYYSYDPEMQALNRLQTVLNQTVEVLETRQKDTQKLLANVDHMAEQTQAIQSGLKNLTNLLKAAVENATAVDRSTILQLIADLKGKVTNFNYTKE